MYKQLEYDPEKDFETISPFAGFTIIVAVTNKLAINTLQELIAYAKAHPGELNYGSVGIGSSQHLAGVYFAQLTGIDITHIPYKNIGQYQPDLMAGTVQLGFQWYPNISSAVQAKGAKTLAVAGANRLDILPDTPTTKEAGLPDYVVSGWFALLSPKGTPPDIVGRLSKEVKLATTKTCVRAFSSKARRRSICRRIKRSNSSPTKSKNTATSSPRRVFSRSTDGAGIWLRGSKPTSRRKRLRVSRIAGCGAAQFDVSPLRYFPASP